MTQFEENCPTLEGSTFLPEKPIHWKRVLLEELTVRQFQKIFHILRDIKVHYRVHKSQPTVHTEVGKI
jgi:hypothetical protein